VGDGSLAQRLQQRIDRDGPLSVSQWVEAALYDPDEGFYMSGGRAGRRGDFLTAPEVGPLFGAVMARAIDSWWADLGRPDVFAIFEVGAGPGTLARSVLRADCEAARRGALRWWAIEISPEQRSQHPEIDLVSSARSLEEALAAQSSGAGAFQGGLVLANELLDNLPFDLVERTEAGWSMVLVAREPYGPGFATALEPLDGPVAAELHETAPAAQPGQRLVWQRGARDWLGSALAAVPGGKVVVLDYGGTTSELLGRGTDWVRTHIEHSGGHLWIDDPGRFDITVDVDFDQLQRDHRADVVVNQAEFLRTHGIDQLVADGRRVWTERAHLGDLVALEARSRVREAEALCDPAGMGSFVVAEWASRLGR